MEKDEQERSLLILQQYEEVEKDQGILQKRRECREKEREKQPRPPCFSTVLVPLRLKIDPGAQTTGLALLNDASGAVVWAAELSHRGFSIKGALDARRAVRRSRRRRHTRFRPSRWANRLRSSGDAVPGNCGCAVSTRRIDGI